MATMVSGMLVWIALIKTVRKRRMMMMYAKNCAAVFQFASFLDTLVMGRKS